MGHAHSERIAREDRIFGTNLQFTTDAARVALEMHFFHSHLPTVSTVDGAENGAEASDAQHLTKSERILILLCWLANLLAGFRPRLDIQSLE